MRKILFSSDGKIIIENDLESLIFTNFDIAIFFPPELRRYFSYQWKFRTIPITKTVSHQRENVVIVLFFRCKITIFTNPTP